MIVLSFYLCVVSAFPDTPELLNVMDYILGVRDKCQDSGKDQSTLYVLIPNHR